MDTVSAVASAVGTALWMAPRALVRAWQWTQPPSIEDTLRDIAAVRDDVRSRLQASHRSASDEAAAALRATDDEQARVHVRLKLMHDAHSRVLQGTLLSLQEHLLSLETSAVHRDVVGALRSGAHAAQRQHVGSTDATVDEAADSLAECRDTSEAVLDALRASGAQGDVQHDRVEAELSLIRERNADCRHRLAIEAPARDASADAAALVLQCPEAPRSPAECSRRPLQDRHPTPSLRPDTLAACT